MLKSAPPPWNCPVCHVCDPHPRRLPPRLPRHLLAHHHGHRWRGHQGARQPRPPHDRRRAVRQGQQVHPAHLPRRPRAAAPPTQRPQGQRPVHPGQLGRGAARHRPAPARDCPAPARGHPALQLCRHHGPGAGRKHGPALLPPAGRQPAGPHHLRQRRQRSPGRHLWRQAGHAHGVFCREPADPDLGQQQHCQQPALLAPGPGGQAQWGQAGVHRPAQERDRREVPRAPAAAARHRRRPGPGADARADRARLAGPRLHRPAHPGLGGPARPGPGVAARARRPGLWPTRGTDPPAGARLRHHPAGRHPPELRHAARARRRQCRACHRLPAGPGRRLAPPCGRPAAVQLGRVALQQGSPATAAAAGRPPPAHAEHEHHRRRAAAPRRCAVRPAGRGRGGLQQQPRGRGPGVGQGGRRLCARGPVHRGAGAFPDRHRRPRRLRAARHHAAGALGHPWQLRPHRRAAEPPGHRPRRPGTQQRPDLP